MGMAEPVVAQHRHGGRAARRLCCSVLWLAALNNADIDAVVNSTIIKALTVATWQRTTIGRHCCRAATLPGSYSKVNEAKNMGAWYIRITGKRRQEIDINLLVQAIIALGEQLRDEESEQECSSQASEQQQPKSEASS